MKTKTEEQKRRLREIAKQYRLRNKVSLKKRHKKDVRENPDKYKNRRTQQRARNPMSYKLLSIRDRAKKKNIECTLTREYLESIWTGICPVFGTQIQIGQGINWGRGKNLNSPNLASLDRIDTSKGYVEGNVQWLSNLANLMKSCASTEQLISFATWILKHKSPIV